jgi:hypothetical protein
MDWGTIFRDIGIHELAESRQFMSNVEDHDDSKLLNIDEYEGYKILQQFRNDPTKSVTEYEIDDARIALFHHVIRNPHHPEHWASKQEQRKFDKYLQSTDMPFPITGHSIVIPEMSELAMLEMILDWLAMAEQFTSHEQAPANAYDWFVSHCLIRGTSTFRWDFRRPEDIQFIQEIFARLRITG